MKKFKEIHQKEIKEDMAPQLGYPDCGSGWYSKELSYKDWFTMNCGQRCQLNFLEQLPIIMITSLLAGIHQARITFYIEIFYCIARLMYGFGYMKSPKARVPGAIMQDLALVALIGLAYKEVYDMIM